VIWGLGVRELGVGMFNASRSAFGVQRSAFDVQCSTFSVRRSAFDVQCLESIVDKIQGDFLVLRRAGDRNTERRTLNAKR